MKVIGDICNINGEVLIVCNSNNKAEGRGSKDWGER